HGVTPSTPLAPPFARSALPRERVRSMTLTDDSRTSALAPLLWAKRKCSPHLRNDVDGQHGLSGRPAYSITSVRTSRIGGIERPSALAVFRFITSSNLFGCSTDKSEGLAPLSIRST